MMYMFGAVCSALHTVLYNKLTYEYSTFDITKKHVLQVVRHGIVSVKYANTLCDYILMISTVYLS
jgi:hypothetical protein